MVKQRILECAFFVPIRRDANLSDGDLHSAEAWEWLDVELFLRFRGGTEAPGLYKGFYEDPDTHMRVPDESRKFIVAVGSSDVKELRRFLAEAKSVFQQKCIYLSIAGEVEFV
jgi:hypothetical protein